MSQAVSDFVVEPTSAGAVNRQILGRHSPFTICLIGGPGNGKTELLALTARRLKGELAMAAIIANPTAERDAQRLKSACVVHPLVTNQLGALELRQTLESMDLSNLDLLIIEHPAPELPGSCEDLGQDAVVAMFSVTDGDDKAAEFPHHVAHSDLVILSKADLLPHVRFNPAIFRQDVRKINGYVRVLEISASEDNGVEEWLGWLRCHVDEKRGPRPEGLDDAHPEWFFG